MSRGLSFFIKLFIVVLLFVIPTVYFMVTSGIALRGLSTGQTIRNQAVQPKNYQTFLQDQQKAGVRAIRFDSSDNLSAIPPEIGNVTTLTSLEIADDPITTLPPEIGNLINLTDLRITGTKLDSLPPEMAKLTKLQNLILSNNKLQSVPDFLSTMKNLQLIDLSVNSIPQQQIDSLKQALPNTQIVF